MTNNWKNLGFVAKFLTKFAIFDEQKCHFWQQNPLEPSYGLSLEETMLSFSNYWHYTIIIIIIIF